MTSYKRKQIAGGFAYLWTLMLVAFMGVGLVIASESYSTSVRRDQERELLFIGRQFQDALGSYYEAKIGGANHQYPARIEDLLKDPRLPGTQRHLRKLYLDPITGKGEWGMIMLQGKIAGFYSLSAKKPIKQGNFEPNDIAFKDSQKYSEWEFTYPNTFVLPKGQNTTPPPNGGDDQFPLK
jgi:hypothetical protein